MMVLVPSLLITIRVFVEGVLGADEAVSLFSPPVFNIVAFTFGNNECRFNIFVSEIKTYIMR